MTDQQPYEPFSNPYAVTWTDDCVRVRGGKPGQMRSIRIVADLDARLYLLFIRDKNGQLPEKPNYAARTRYFAKHWGKEMKPPPEDQGLDVDPLEPQPVEQPVEQIAEQPA